MPRNCASHPFAKPLASDLSLLRMPSDHALDIVRQTLLLAVVLAAPLLGVTFAVSFVVSLLQTMTGVQDATVSLTPRLAVGALALLWLLPWMIERLADFSTDLYRGLPFGA